MNSKTLDGGKPSWESLGVLGSPVILASPNFRAAVQKRRISDGVQQQQRFHEVAVASTPTNEENRPKINCQKHNHSNQSVFIVAMNSSHGTPPEQGSSKNHQDHHQSIVQAAVTLHGLGDWQMEKKEMEM